MSRLVAVWLVIIGAGVATYAIRASFLLFADRLAAVPPKVSEVLRMIPAAALGALVAPALLRPEATFAPLGPRALAGLVALAVAWFTRNLLITIIVGIAAVIGFERFLG